jgi:hypothetical protein
MLRKLVYLSFGFILTMAMACSGCSHSEQDAQQGSGTEDSFKGGSIFDGGEFDTPIIIP